MCFMGGPPKPKAPPPPPSDIGADIDARRDVRQRAAAAKSSGRQSTLITGSLGAPTSGTAKKVLLGS